nr:FkbM family methyltransferase [Thiocapsa sp.]
MRCHACPWRSAPSATTAKTPNEAPYEHLPTTPRHPHPHTRKPNSVPDRQQRQHPRIPPFHAGIRPGNRRSPGTPRDRWPKARLICFEPLPGPRAKLARVTRGQAEIHDCAPGAAPGEGRMHLATRTDSSSLLALGARQKAIYGMEESGELRVPIKRLDACHPTPPKRPAQLKIDVQGFELEVLKGATDLLPNVDAVYVEASYVELYEGQALHEEIEHFLIEAGYNLDGRFNTHVHQGEPVQADLLFRRRTSS